MSTMINSILISGPESLWQDKYEEIVAKLLKKPLAQIQPFWQSVDFQVVGHDEKNSLGIEEIRELEKTLTLRPVSFPIKVFLIKEAEKMTVPAQNAFLKTLEEHPEYSIIILCTVNFQLLLPTIISRCQKILLTPKDFPQTAENLALGESSLKTIYDSAAPGPKFKLAEEHGKDKSEAVDFLNLLILCSRQILLTDDLKKAKNETLNPEKLITFIRNCELTKKYLQANVNPRFALENLFLSC